MLSNLQSPRHLPFPFRPILLNQVLNLPVLRRQVFQHLPDAPDRRDDHQRAKPERPVLKIRSPWRVAVQDAHAHDAARHCRKDQSRVSAHISFPYTARE